MSRYRRKSPDLGAYKFDDLTIAQTGSSAYSGGEGGSSEPVTQVIHKGINALSVGSFEGQGVGRSGGGERTMERGRPEVGSKLNKDAEYVSE